LRSAPVAKSTESSSSDVKSMRLTIADVDNNGAADLIISGEKSTLVLLGTATGEYIPAAQPIHARILAASPDPSAPSGQHLLGQTAATDALRIVWPNGNVQGEVELKPDAAFTADQRLKGSCPMLFTFDGGRMQFVTDCLWRSPLGLRINAQDTAQTTQTEDWV